MVRLLHPLGAGLKRVGGQNLGRPRNSTGYEDVRAQAINGGPLAGFRNLLINPRFTINQRRYSSGNNVGSANEYTVDRWRVVTSGQNMSWTESDGIRTVTAPAGGVAQTIAAENVFTGPHTISWDGTATCTVGGVARQNGETFDLSGTGNVSIVFSGGTVAKPQLEPGRHPTVFEIRFEEIERRLCGSYFERIDDDLGNDVVFGAGHVRDGSRAQIWWQFETRKRTQPTISGSLTTSAFGVFRTTTASGDLEFNGSDSVSVFGARISLDGGSGGLTGGQGVLGFFSNGVGGYLEADCEL